MNDEFTTPTPAMHMPDMSAMSGDSATMTPVHVEEDHEVKMAQGQLYRAAKNSIELHKMLKFVSELEGWVQAKITIAAENLEAVKNYIEYEMVSQTLAESTAQDAKLLPHNTRLKGFSGRVIEEGFNFNDKKGRWEWDDGTTYDPAKLTPAQKARVAQWKAANPGKRQGRADPDTRDNTRLKGFSGRVIEEGLEEGMSDVLQGLKKGAKEFWHGSPEERAGEHSELKSRWLSALKQVGIEGTQASTMADKMIAQGFEPNKTSLKESRPVKKRS